MSQYGVDTDLNHCASGSQWDCLVRLLLLVLGPTVALYVRTDRRSTIIQARMLGGVVLGACCAKLNPNKECAVDEVYDHRSSPI